MAMVMKKRKFESAMSVVSLKRPCNFSSLLRPDTTAHVLALEALLRNPVRFTPATDQIKHNRKKKMATSFSDRVSKWRVERDTREKRRRLVMRYLSSAWEPYIKLQGIRSIGLHNTGVTCYRNASIQVLMHLPIFLNWLEDYHHPDDCQTRDACMACNLRLLKLAFWARYSAHTLRTAAVKTATDRINGKLLSMGWKEPENVQHDSREFLLWMIMTIRRQLPQSQVETFDAIFGFVSDEEIECKTCKTKRFLAPKDVTTNPEYNLLTDLVGIKQGERLTNVIRRNFHNTRQAKCENPGCGDHGDKSLRQFITLAPEVLICPLKRFEGTYDPKTRKMTTEKVKTKIAFDEYLDLSKFNGHPENQIGGRLLYGLSSVVYHSGSLAGGHYISVARGPDDVWRTLNDQRVTDIELWTALSYTPSFDAYILTYTKYHGPLPE